MEDEANREGLKMWSPKLTLNRMTYRLHPGGSRQQPVYVFHHIPKCGGTSIVKALGQWFHPVFDYRHGWRDTIASPIPLKNLRSNHCLCGHFDHDHIYIDQRYPGMLEDQRFRVFTFIRDPLKAKLSLYRYEMKFGRVNTSLSKFLFARPNYLSQRLPAKIETVKTFLDRYHFVGTVENMQQGFDWLADDAGKPRIILPTANQTVSGKKDTSLDIGLLAEFRQENSVDYALYDYALMRERDAFHEPGSK